MRLPRHFVPRSDIKGASRSVGVSRSDRELGVSRVENFFMRYALRILYFFFVIARHAESMSWQSHTLLPALFFFLPLTSSHIFIFVFVFYQKP
jgi:hypothetical protein